MPWPYHLRCFNCHTQYPTQTTNYRCEKCGGLLEVNFQISSRKTPWKKRGLTVWKYRELLPIDNDRFVTNLAEGGTGLHHRRRLRRAIGLTRLSSETEGEKTLAFEVCEQLDAGVPVALVLPVGSGGNVSAIWKAVTEFQTLGVAKTRRRMIGVQADNAAPIAKAGKRKQNKIQPVTNPRTIASAIRIGSPVNWTKVLPAINESRGTAETVSDKEILQAQRDLASKEGIFAEPASAASIAGLRKSREAGRVDRSDLVVCVTTGHGLKDPSIADHMPHQDSYTLKITQRDWIERLERIL